MNAIVQIHPVLRLVLPVLFALALFRPVHAAEPITMVWLNTATAVAYEVTAPDDRLLSEVKQQVMTGMGLSPLQSPLYAVEKVVVTSMPVRGQYDPVTGLPLVITTEEYLLLVESFTLAELELFSGDSLRLRQIAAASEDDPAGGATDDTTTDSTDTTDDTAEDTDGGTPVKAGHHRGHKKHHHHHHGKHHKHKHSNKYRFG
jgi:hypothetical protein